MLESVWRKGNPLTLLVGMHINTKVTYFAETNEEHEANKAMIEQQYIDEANAAAE